MREYLTPLLFFQRFFLPALFLLVLWASWRTVWKKDLGVGLALYLGLVIIVDGFLNTGIFIPGVQRGSIRYSEVCAGFLLLSRPPALLRESTYNAVRFFVGLYFVLLIVSAFRSEPVLTGLMGFRMVIVPQIVAFALAVRGMRSPEDLRRFFRSMALLAMITALFIFWDLFFDRWLLRSDMLSKPEYWLNRRHGRYGSFFLNPNLLGAFSVLVFPAMFAYTLGEKRLRNKIVASLGLLSLVFCLIETQSRGPLLAFSIVLTLFLLGPAGEMSRMRRLGVFLPLLAVLALMMPGFYEHALTRFESIDQETTMDARSRQTTWLYTQRIIADYPLAGIGFGEHQFLKAMDTYGFKQEFGEESLDNPHNSYLQMTVYAGFPALISFLLANLLLLVRAAVATLRRSAGEVTPMIFGLAIGVAGFLTTIYPDMHMFTQTVAPVYWVFVGLLLSSATTVRQAALASTRAPGVQSTERWRATPVAATRRSISAVEPR